MNRFKFLRKNWLKIQDFMDITHHSRGIYRIYLDLIKKKPKESQHVIGGTWNIGILTDYAQNPP
jgi:hypothetical protein